MKIVCISGKARHGKDTAANYMRKKLELSGKKVLVAHYADLLKYICKTIFNWNGVKDENGRQLLQYVGTDVIREQNPDYWVDFIIGILDMFYGDWDYVLIPDCRFPNEVERLKEADFDTVSVKIVRDDFVSELTEEQKNHKSETAMDNFDFDFVVHNRDMGGFYKNLNQLLIDIEAEVSENEEIQSVS